MGWFMKKGKRERNVINRIVCWVYLFLLCVLSVYVNAEMIYLTNGRAIEGKVIKETNNSITIRTKNRAAVFSVNKDRIRSIEKSANGDTGINAVRDVLKPVQGVFRVVANNLKRFFFRSSRKDMERVREARKERYERQVMAARRSRSGNKKSAKATRKKRIRKETEDWSKTRSPVKSSGSF